MDTHTPVGQILYPLSHAAIPLSHRYRDDGHTYTCGTDTMDVWFDSGSSWHGVVHSREVSYNYLNLEKKNVFFFAITTP